MGTEDIQNLLNASIGEVSVGAIIAGIVTLVICLFVIRIVMKMVKSLKNVGGSNWTWNEETTTLSCLASK